MAYNNPAVTSDIAVLCLQRQDLKILLVKRKNPPFQGDWALPGGFLEPNESLMQSAARELQEETGVTDVCLYPIGMFDKVERDPRGRTLTMAFWTMIPLRYNQIKAGSDAENTKWFSLKELPKLAFDHADIIAALKQQLKHLYQNALPLLTAAEDVTVKKLKDALESL